MPGAHTDGRRLKISCKYTNKSRAKQNLFRFWIPAPEHYTVFNHIAVDLEIDESAQGNDDGSENIKPIVPGDSTAHDRVEYPAHDDKTPHNSECQPYVAFDAIAYSHDVFFILSDAYSAKKLQTGAYISARR